MLEATDNADRSEQRRQGRNNHLDDGFDGVLFHSR